MPLPLSNMDKAFLAMGEYPMTVDQVAEEAVLPLAAAYSALRRLVRTGVVTEFTVEKNDTRPKCRFYTRQKVA